MPHQQHRCTAAATIVSMAVATAAERESVERYFSAKVVIPSAPALATLAANMSAVTRSRLKFS